MSKLKNTIKDLKTILPAEGFIVTGSAALSKFGLKKENDVQDIDIILVKPTETALGIMQRMMEQYPAKTKPGKNPTSNLKSVFLKDGFKVDVFIEEIEESLEIDGVHYALPLNIVTSKKRYNRVKDWLQLRELSRLFFKQEEFEAYLNNNPKFTIEYKADEEDWEADEEDWEDEEKPYIQAKRKY